MTPARRALDLTLALALGAALALPFAVLVLWLRLTQPGPVFHAAERMMAPGRPFRLWKLRTMAPSAGDGGVTGGHKAALVTPAGRFLRRTRLDEVPQLWNVIRGEMSLVGPRPPLRTYVERFPGLYARVLRSRPGITGLATLVFHRHEERILSRCRTPAETDAAYARRCVPRKARLDLIHARRRTVGLDLWILWRTALRRQRKSSAVRTRR
ncbi:MAG TPA: sugar transferase [Paracoccaceae bacterium]|nr:sugar transferase [Paracoccaceae bacterium]HMO70365.1 sugar transferase [Paracoccaceae bacterium]